MDETGEVRAEYLEKRLGGSRRFTLTDTHLVLEARKLLEAKVSLRWPLANINPGYATLEVAGRGFRSGLAVFLVGAFAAGITYYANRDSFLDYRGEGDFLTPLRIAIGLGLLSLGGLAAMLFTPRRRHYVSFGTTGATTNFDICKRGPHRDEFDGFVATLVDAIKTAHAEEGGAPDGEGQ